MGVVRTAKWTPSPFFRRRNLHNFSSALRAISGFNSQLSFNWVLLQVTSMSWLIIEQFASGNVKLFFSPCQFRRVDKLITEKRPFLRAVACRNQLSLNKISILKIYFLKSASLLFFGNQTRRRNNINFTRAVLCWLNDMKSASPTNRRKVKVQNKVCGVRRR